MDLSVEEVVNGILSKEAQERPSDTVKQEQLILELPQWYDKDLYNKGRRFYWDNCFALSASLIAGLLAILAVPSILRILIGTRRSSSAYTAYKRYLSTLLHVVTWFEHDLEPGSKSWKSLHEVRCRHMRATLSSKLQGNGVVSQRDMALTLFGFFGFPLLKPNKSGISQRNEGEWEGFNHFWSVMGHMLGLEDRYNICRKNVDETRQVCQALLERVFTPCLDNVPEYFEHMARSMLKGLWSANPLVEAEPALYWCRHLADVPGYVYTEEERIKLQRRLRELLKGKPKDSGVDSRCLIAPSAIEDLPVRSPRLLYLHDYDTLDAAPEYKRLNVREQYKLFLASVYAGVQSTYLGRLFLNFQFNFSVFLMKYLPFLGFLRFGVKNSYVNIFVEDPPEDVVLKPNSEYYKPRRPLPWYRILLSFLFPF